MSISARDALLANELFKAGFGVAFPIDPKAADLDLDCSQLQLTFQGGSRQNGSSSFGSRASTSDMDRRHEHDLTFDDFVDPNCHGDPDYHGDPHATPFGRPSFPAWENADEEAGPLSRGNVQGQLLSGPAIIGAMPIPRASHMGLSNVLNKHDAAHDPGAAGVAASSRAADAAANTKRALARAESLAKRLADKGAKELARVEEKRLKKEVKDSAQRLKKDTARRVAKPPNWKKPEPTSPSMGHYELRKLKTKDENEAVLDEIDQVEADKLAEKGISMELAKKQLAKKPKLGPSALIESLSERTIPVCHSV